MLNKVIVVSFLFLGSFSSLAADRDLNVTGDTVKAFAVSCTDAATPVLAAAGDIYTSLQCSSLGAIPVYLGAGDVDTTDGYPVCTNPSLCGVSTQSIASNNLYCIVASGSADLRCLAVVR